MRAVAVLPAVPIALALAVAPAARASRTCPIVDRGSPTDGVTTVTLVRAPAPCAPDPLWNGWYCAGLQTDANDNGVSYTADVRWNRVGLPCAATVTWLQGGGKTHHREATVYAQAVQDELDTLDGIRTVEIKFLGNAFLTAPRNGYPNVAAIYADVLEYLVAQGIIEGVRVHFGNSGGGTVGANCLSYHGLDQVLDGMVFGGSPYWGNLELTCLDPNWATSRVRGDADDWNWFEFNGSTPCSTFSATPNPSYTCRSTLGVDADSVYDNVMISVVVGQQDVFQPWIDADVGEWYSHVTAERKTYDRPANCGHTTMDFQSGAATVEQRIREIVSLTATALGSAPGPAPSGISLAASPNPFGATTVVRFAMPEEGPVRLSVHDAAGRRVATLVDGERSAGRYGAEWNGRDDGGHPVPAGVYFVRLRAGRASETRKVVRVR